MTNENRCQLKLALILSLLAAFLLVAGRDVCSDYMPPNPELIVAMGCSIEEYKAPDKYHWWHVYVWARDYKENRWQRLFAIREITQRAKAMQDCEKWLRCTERRIRETKRRSASGSAAK